MTRLAALILLAAASFSPPALAQQNQSPGDTGAGGSTANRAPEAAQASTAQAGANTTDGTTTGSSGPKKGNGGPPGNRELPPLPSADLCSNYEGLVQAECLATTLYQRLDPLPGGDE